MGKTKQKRYTADEIKAMKKLAEQPIVRIYIPAEDKGTERERNAVDSLAFALNSIIINKLIEKEKI